MQHAAIEQHVRWTGEPAGAASDGAVLHRGRLLPQEARHVPGDGGIGGVRQSDLLQAHAPLPRRHILAGHVREEALAQNALDVVAMQRRLDGAAHQAGSLAQDGHRLLRLLGGRIEQLFLGHAAVVPQRLQLQAVDLRALLRQPVGHQARQRQVDIVAAQQDVLAYGNPVQRQFAALLGHGDQREIRGAAADIDDQDQVARL